MEDMSKMSFVSLINILLSNVEETEKKPTQEDIDKMFGWGVEYEIYNFVWWWI